MVLEASSRNPAEKHAIPELFAARGSEMVLCSGVTAPVLCGSVPLCGYAPPLPMTRVSSGLYSPRRELSRPGQTFQVYKPVGLKAHPCSGQAPDVR